jgi:alkanesulfonate monooxygenase SsuD/methylene tetrahydromethanopterin reductase-like flavin-dependent oxidoreductase (luciferase family)
MSAMEFYYFHLMPWPHLPADFDRACPSSWVTLSNRVYDPKQGHRLYNEYLDELEYAEALGFDGLGVNEHHQNAYGTMPSPNLMAAALARRTSRVKLAVLGNAIALREHPLRVAEEIAMLDVLSGGRVISGFVRGIGCEYFSLGVNPTYSRERFYEAHDLILRSWTEPGPFSFEGRHYRVRYANVWPRPLQSPHPPVWLPSQGSTETVRFGAEHRYPFVTVFTSYTQAKRLLEEYKAQARALGYDAPPRQLGFAVPVYVAETDARAHREAKDHFLWLFKRGLKIPPQFLAPPGYLSEGSLLKFLAAGLRPPSELDFQELESEGYILLGSPASVRDRLREIEKDLGIGLFIGGGRIGDMSHAKATRSAELFASEVIPHFRHRGRARSRRAAPFRARSAK